jgi:Mg2+ and Co2+ transporter CorA
MSESLSELADAIGLIERRVSDVIFDAVRAQLREDETDEARELERRLARVRRSLQKAEGLLRGYDGD